MPLGILYCWVLWNVPDKLCASVPGDFGIFLVFNWFIDLTAYIFEADV